MGNFEETKLYHIRNNNANSKLVVGQLLHAGQEYNPFYGVYEKKEIEKITMDPNCLLGLTTYYWHFARESTLEEVRREHFPSLPSRQKCLYVTSPENLNYWLETFKHTECQVVEVQIIDKLFKCDASLIEGNPKALSRVRNNAMRYWKGEITNKEKVEYLVEGEVKVVHILNKKEINSITKKSGRVMTGFWQ
ncbi:hypothetical protein CN959_23045 [Bacillus cereus]|uniref:DUF2441 domain-containing protein n=1 Tax=Bacillus cereus TaxID=1396 RepID=UPI000BFCA164|nr:DUF2441 domain-containing protein [Bacillus cereus]PGM98060.1 hypothetical protein CN959_23045 [Bacillus cereus]